MNGASGSRWVGRLARLLLLLYPPTFRREVGTEVAEAWVTLIVAARRRGVIAAAWAWAGGVVDLIGGAAREWRRSIRGSSRVNGGRGAGMFDSIARDFRMAVRGLARHPLFTLVAAGSLAIGIGANTAVFSVANTLLLQPLPEIPAYDRVVELGRSTDARGFDTFSYPDFLDVRDGVDALADAAAYSMEVFSVSLGDEGMRASGFYVSASYFDVLGAVPAAGRFFVPEEDTGFGEHPVVVVSHRFWRDRLGSDPDVLGSTILVNRVPFEVVGVTAERFVGHMVGIAPDVLIPLTQSTVLEGRREQFDHRGSSWLLALGRLADGATLETLDAQLDGVSARLAEAYPRTNARRTFSALPLGPVPGGGRGGVRLFFTALIAMVSLILLVTCTNVAGMFLSRATAREREFAVRLSLGAGRSAVVQQLTIETLLVFLLGGGMGLAVGIWLVGLLRPDMIPAPIPIHFAIRPDATVVVVGLLTTLLTGLVFGLLPAARATRMDLTSAMREDHRSGGRGVGRLRLVFAGSQVGLSLVLLATAALFVRSLQRANDVETGFDPADTYVTFIDLSLEGYDEESGPGFQQELLEALRGRPWVEAASLSTDLPLDLSSSGTAVRPEGWDMAAEAELFPIDFNRVSSGYFDALAIGVLAGRAIDDRDREGTRRVAVVSQRFVDDAWPGEDPLGRTFRLGRATDDDDAIYEIVGVVEDTKNQVVTEAAKPFVYFALSQWYAPDTQIAVRANVPEERAVAELRGALVAADPNMSRGPVIPLGEYTSLGLLPQRIAAGLTGTLALIALLLAALGIYGVVAFAVHAQRREIGIRMALGAEASQVVRRLVRSGLALAGPGLVLGGLLSLAVGRLVRSLLLDLSPSDPVALGSVAVLLLVVVLVAAWIPARRAARVDPAESLRRE